jgi:NADH-quinone oxidoreductase subunit M
MFALLAVVGIVYGALVALAQTDFKFVIGYSSVSHMGFVLLGLMTLNQIGVTGAVMQMFSHGIIAGLLFAIVGRVVYDRTHTRQFAELETMHLARRLPFAAWAFVVAGTASMGLNLKQNTDTNLRPSLGRRSPALRCWRGQVCWWGFIRDCCWTRLSLP